MINSNYFILCVILLVMGTLIIRGSFIAFSGKIVISPKIRELFTFIPASILPALVIPATFFHQGSVDWLMHKERFIVLLIASIACYFYRNTLFVISLGLLLLYVIKFVI